VPSGRIVAKPALAVLIDINGTAPSSARDRSPCSFQLAARGENAGECTDSAVAFSVKVAAASEDASINRGALASMTRFDA